MNRSQNLVPLPEPYQHPKHHQCVHSYRNSACCVRLLRVVKQAAGKPPLEDSCYKLVCFSNRNWGSVGSEEESNAPTMPH